jgi:two-component system, cell cycle response regulator
MPAPRSFATPRDVPPPVRVGLKVLGGAAVVALAAFVLHAPLGLGSGVQDWLGDAVVLAATVACLARAILVREERVAWACFAFGLATWAVGDVYNSLVLAKLPNFANPPVPSLSDICWLALYPSSYVGLLLLVRHRLCRVPRSLWLDGLIGMLAVVALGGALLLGPIMHQTGRSWQGVATDVAYPLGDFLLIGFLVGILLLTGWRAFGAWLAIALALVLTAAADVFFVYLGTVTVNFDWTALDALFPAATLLIAFAAWQPVRVAPPVRIDGLRLLVTPALFALVALGLLVYSQFHALNAIAIGFATATLAVVIVRMALTFGEYLRALEVTREQALTDVVTSLGNRRRLFADLEMHLRRTPTDSELVLVLMDLDGFKAYNDTFGHPAGDRLLASLGDTLAAVANPHGGAYRLGGDEFCALVDERGCRPDDVVGAVRAKLAGFGETVRVGVSSGTVRLPAEAHDATAALQVADERLYVEKGERMRATARKQTRDILLQAMHEREPELRDHALAVAGLAAAVGRRMGIEPAELESLIRAAELHEVGRFALVDPPADADTERNRRWRVDVDGLAVAPDHSIVGERILAAASALALAARLVRSSCERYDGRGYPDGLAGASIPLGARIIGVCDAFAALTSGTHDGRRLDPGDALARLRAEAGVVFDPAVVDALAAVMAEHRGPVAVDPEPGAGAAAA